MDNYPRVDGSTSTDPLNYIIAAHLLGLEYEWVGDGRPIQVSQVNFKNGNELPNTFREKIQLSQTHGAIINLIDKTSNIFNPDAPNLFDTTDLIIVARKMSADEREYADAAGVSLIETPIAIDALDFIVDAQNTVNSLTVEEIQNIYLGNITNWSEAGGTDETIIPYIRNANSGSQEMMNEIVMDNAGMPDWEVSFADEQKLGSMLIVYAELKANTHGICFTPHYYKEYMVSGIDGIKTLAVNGIKPDANSIKTKNYPFVANVYVSIRSDLDHNSMAYKLYQWLQTEAGKKVIRESGYVTD